MKKLLIVSLFLLSMIGLMAQGTPHNAVFDLQTSTGGIHPAGTFGFRAIEFHNTLDSMWDLIYPGSPRSELYFNWPGEEDLNTGDTQYNVEIGRIGIQMATMEHWGPGVSANFYFIDSDGNEVGPYTIAKGTGDATFYPDVIAWGGPVGPTPPDAWATYQFPANGATGVAINVNDEELPLPVLTWAYAGTVDPDGFEVWVNGVDMGDVAYDSEVPMFNYSFTEDLEYSTTYEWGIKPYVNDDAKRVMKKTSRDLPSGRLYPEGTMQEWTFTTMDEPVVIVYPTWAANATPENGATDVALMPTLTWTYDGPAVDGFEIWVGVVDVIDVVDMGDVTEGMSYTFDADLDYNTEYEWGVKPYIIPATKGMKGQRIESRRYPNEGTMPTTTFTTTNIIPESDDLVTETENPVIPDIPVIPASLQFIAVTVNQPTAGLYGITFTLPQAYIDMRVLVGGISWPLDTPDADGQWAEVDGLTVTVWILFTGGKEEKDIVIVDDSTLPVTLSSFSANAHANEYVTLKWVTESESNLQGYNVYRAETDNQDQAIRINPTMVAPHNQTQTQTYTYTDNEVESTTYYYWLEVAELANENSFHGPIVVTVEDDPVVPGITETTFRNFGPSPFTESTSTSLRVKEGETATVTIYNLLGQVVRRESFNAGEHNFEFNGRDLNNKKVANGIYFVRMTSPTQTKNFKIVKIK